MRAESAHWWIGLDAWIIQDGNYGDFSSGDRAEFALEFFPMGDVLPRDSSSISAVHLGDDVYDIVARVVHTDHRAWVADFGLRAYNQSRLPAGLEVGSMIGARVGLGVDPFTYFERLSKDGRFPDLVYTWDVVGIQQVMARWVLRGKTWNRDEASMHVEELARTNAWTDDGSHGSYLLECALRAMPPKRTSSTAIT
ncbi:hypothetical protein [Ruania alba]|uniref:Uncharacterized protein n=1 Tax=Ruania alba TaxID=648782 RepID=A0A1H5ML52_9MICO|nr:hypothetical protein [Ruania alba]SEE90105.1 hypothetical protein SAMN04488554_3474 [Ruania alba]